MALKATIYKATVNVADMDRNVFLDSTLTLACHPSETESRLMMRLLAWLYHASEYLQFTRGLCADDEPDIWLLNDHQGIEHWIEVGLPDERNVKKASHRSNSVSLYAYNQRAAQAWWAQNSSKLARLTNLTVWFLDDRQLADLTRLVARNMSLQATLQDGILWLSDAAQHLEIHLDNWQINGKAQ